MIRYSVLGSGSSGNGYVFDAHGCSILVDNGFSRAELKRRFLSEGFDYSQLQTVFVTHLHPDHVRGVGTISRMDLINVVLPEKSIQPSSAALISKLNISEEKLGLISPEKPVKVGPFRIESFYTSHDSDGSSGYSIGCDGYRFTIITDTGKFDSTMVDYARNSDVVFLESNYDPKMLSTGPYPMALKRRIDGLRGHLSNSQAEEFLNQCGFFQVMTEENNIQLCYNHSKSRTDRVYLVHLSDTNNDVELLKRRFNWMGDILTVCPKGQTRSGSIGE